jgi:3-oxoacyl-[acyl-carrier protein] reductase
MQDGGPRTVMVTGGSRGLGLAIARRLVASGYRVVAVARRQGEELAAAMRGAAPGRGEGSLHFVPFDLGRLFEVPDLVGSVRAEHGPIYGLVNNAALGTSGVLAIMPDAAIESLVRLNTASPLILTKYVARSMMAGRGGRIVSVSSIVSFTGSSGLSAYAATKASMIGMTKSLARELGPLGINVNAVAPGFVDTEMTRELTGEQREQIIRRSALRRLAAATDVADAVEFLLGDGSRSITGTVLTVDAGATA